MAAARDRLDPLAWTLTATRGFAAMAIGVFALAQPTTAPFATSRVSTPVLLGVFALIDGTLSLAIGWLCRGTAWAWRLAEAAAGYLVGLVCLLAPALPEPGPTYLLGGWVGVLGAAHLLIARDLRTRGDQNRYWLTVTGVIGVALCLFLLVNPEVGAVLITNVLALFAVPMGIALALGGFWLARTRSDMLRPRCP